MDRTLPTRFLLLTNEVPRFTDASGALASRFVILTLTKSFYGCEDPELTASLLGESPAIFNWSMEGLDRLTDQGYFQMPASAQDALRHLEDLASPVSAFTRDRARIHPGVQIAKEELWKAWKAWADTEGMPSGTKAVFVRDLRAAVPGLKPRRIGGVHVIEGIALHSEFDQQSEIPLHTPARPPEIDSVQGSAGVFPIVEPIK